MLSVGSFTVALVEIVLRTETPEGVVVVLTAIVYALTPDEKWDARHNPDHAVVATAWGAVLAAIAALLIGGAVLMGTIAFSGQKFFEWQLEPSAGTGR